MKLYDVPNGSMIRVLDDIQTPAASPEILKGDVIKFLHLDGMYSFCKNGNGETVHLVAWADVEIA